MNPVAGRPIGRFLVLVALASVAFAACSGGGTPAPSGGGLAGKISFLHKYSDPRYAPYFEAVVAAYMAEHPKVQIEIQAESDQGVKDKLPLLEK